MNKIAETILNKKISQARIHIAEIDTVASGKKNKTLEESTRFILAREAVKRKIQIYEKALSMADDEQERLKEFPAWQDNMGACKDIKDRYNLSWEELRNLRDIFHEEP